MERGDSEVKYFLRGSNIIVDDAGFKNDILVTYYIIPTTLASIPTRFHFGIPGYIAMTLIELPNQDDRQFASLQMKQKIARELWRTSID
jgi:hypothetical protein